MKATPLLDHYNQGHMASILGKTPLFDWILHTASPEFPKLLAHCRLFRMRPGETLLRKGELNQWIYVLLKGGCFAFVDEFDRTPINQIGPNEIVGEVSSILNEPRSAFIVANYDQPETFLVGLDFSIILEEASGIDSQIRLLLLQAVQRTIFKRLQSVQRDLAPIRPLPAPLPRLETPPPYIKPEEKIGVYFKNCQEGALALKQLSAQLAEALNEKPKPALKL